MLTSEYAPITQAGNGVTTTFNFSFKILAATDLAVTKKDASGNNSGTLVLGTDYTVTFDPIAETGSVTFTVAVASGGSCTIARASDNTQQSSLSREGPAPAKVTETMIDKTTALIQELQATVAALGGVSSGGTAITAYIGSDVQAQAFAAANPSVPILGIFLTSRTIQLYLANSALGTNGWAVIGGF